MENWKEVLKSIRATLPYNNGYKETFEFAIADLTTGDRKTIILRGFSPEQAIREEYPEDEYDIEKKSETEFVIGFYGDYFQIYLIEN